MIDIRYYDSDDFKKIVSYNFDIAKSLYEQYIDQADGEQAFSKEKKFVPKDVEIYCPMFNIKTNSGCIYSALKDGDINTLINILKYTCVGSIEVVYRHYNLNLFGKKKIIRLLDTIYKYGVHVYTTDSTTEDFLYKCKYRCPSYSISWNPDIENLPFNDDHRQTLRDILSDNDDDDDDNLSDPDSIEHQVTDLTNNNISDHMNWSNMDMWDANDNW